MLQREPRFRPIHLLAVVFELDRESPAGRSVDTEVTLGADTMHEAELGCCPVLDLVGFSARVQPLLGIRDVLNSLHAQISEAFFDTLDELRAAEYIPPPNRNREARSVLIHFIVGVAFG